MLLPFFFLAGWPHTSDPGLLPPRERHRHRGGSQEGHLQRRQAAAPGLEPEERDEPGRDERAGDQEADRRHDRVRDSDREPDDAAVEATRGVDDVQQHHHRDAQRRR